MNEPLQLTIVGGGMITADQLLPSIYHLQRTGVVGEISICALNNAPLTALRDDPGLAAAFPGQHFTPHPSFNEPRDRQFPGLYREVLAAMPKRQAVVVAVPDHLHHETVKAALERDQHVLCVKPLVLRHAEAVELAGIARERGLFVGIEYHKRFDRRSLVARRAYREGRFGAFAIGEARLIEPYYYRNSNFQNWFTVDRTDPFTYIGCHYVDLVYFITGLQPVEVSVRGVRGRFPNGNEGFLWSHGTVRWENGALLSVVNGLGYPDLAAGSNDQGLVMYCEGDGRTGMIRHDDHDRGVSLAYLDGSGPGGSHFNYVSPDYLRLVPWEGPGFRPVGYGYDSVEASILTMARIEGAVRGMDPGRSLAERRRMLAEVDERGILATPANSSVNELVVEAARKSILADGAAVRIP
ncbi:MAG: Gfo/Idh/MocA family oxidoreductase [Spirochaetes bacterium]|nr:Gfo/Idh/MocA family oxidoreductase [Spirochaetota bacterium]